MLSLHGAHDLVGRIIRIPQDTEADDPVILDATRHDLKAVPGVVHIRDQRIVLTSSASFHCTIGVGFHRSVDPSTGWIDTAITRAEVRVDVETVGSARFVNTDEPITRETITVDLFCTDDRLTHGRPERDGSVHVARLWVHGDSWLSHHATARVSAFDSVGYRFLHLRVGD